MTFSTAQPVRSAIGHDEMLGRGCSSDWHCARVGVMLRRWSPTLSPPMHADLPGPSRSRHFGLFDAMRAVAVLGVLMIHVGSASGANQNAWYGVATSHGRLGVRIFFMISAFLLYRPFVMTHLRGGPRSAWTGYAKRRVLRIVPAYWVALTALAIWPGLKGVWTSDWWIHFGLLQAYWPATIFSGLGVAWSLTIEVTFYAVLPFLALFLGWIGRGASARTCMRRQMAVLLALGIGSEIFRLYVFGIGRIDLNFTLVSMFLPFAVGMMLAVSSAWLGSDERRWWWTRFAVDRPGACWAIASMIFIGLCFSPVFKRAGIGAHTVTTWGVEQLGYVVISALLLLPAVFGENATGWPRWLLAHRGLGFMGMVSYGIFLWHQPLLRVMTEAGWARLIPGWPFMSLLTLCIGVSLLVGWASYRWIEEPAMRLRDEAPKRVSRSRSHAA